jgi:hypothetical protein
MLVWPLLNRSRWIRTPFSEDAALPDYSSPSTHLTLNPSSSTNTDSDWERFSECIRQNGIGPMVYHSIQRSGLAGMIPLITLLELKCAYYGNAARNELLYCELREVLRALKTAGTAVIVLKGAALAETVYGNRALRWMSDIDLLVRKEELSCAEDRLAAIGYVLEQHQQSKEWLKQHYYHLVFRRKGGVPIEVHWHLDRPNRAFSIDLDGIWKRAVPATIAGVEALVLSPEDLLPYLCHHTACHHVLDGGLRTLCDIAETTQRYCQQIEWDEVTKHAREWRIERYVYLTLRLAKELLEAAVPDSVLDALKPERFDEQLFAWAREKTLTAKEASPISRNFAEFWKGSWIKAKLPLLLRAFSAEAIARNYPVSPGSMRVFSYYPARLRDLLGQYRLAIGTLVRRDPYLTAVVERAYRTSRLEDWLTSEHE